MFLASVVGLFWYVSRQEFYRSYTQQEQDGDGGPTSPEINLLHVLREGGGLKKLRSSPIMVLKSKKYVFPQFFLSLP